MSDDFRDEDRAAILARRQRFIALALGGLSTGCVPKENPSDGGTTTIASSTTSTSSTDDSSSETETELETETETGLDSLTFVPTGPRPCLSACDTFAQDCPEGEKCVAYGSTGDNWDDSKCVPITGDGAAGEPCVYGGTVEATDDCDESSSCWSVQDLEGTLTGVCAPFCVGNPDNWLCDEGSTCLIANEGSITLCLAECDPLMSDCGEGLACSWTGEAFACLVTTTGQPAGDPCGFANDCAPGSLCAAAEASPMCAGAACCVEYCALDDPESCPDPQLECAGMFAQGEAPAGLETLGLCLAPGACDGEDPGCLEHAIADPIDSDL